MHTQEHHNNAIILKIKNYVRSALATYIHMRDYSSEVGCAVYECWNITYLTIITSSKQWYPIDMDEVFVMSV